MLDDIKVLNEKRVKLRGRFVKAIVDVTNEEKITDHDDVMALVITTLCDLMGLYVSGVATNEQQLLDSIELAKKSIETTSLQQFANKIHPLKEYPQGHHD